MSIRIIKSIKPSIEVYLIKLENCLLSNEDQGR